METWEWTDPSGITLPKNLFNHRWVSVSDYEAGILGGIDETAIRSTNVQTEVTFILTDLTLPIWPLCLNPRHNSLTDSSYIQMELGILLLQEELQITEQALISVTLKRLFYTMLMVTLGKRMIQWTCRIILSPNSQV